MIFSVTEIGAANERYPFETRVVVLSSSLDEKLQLGHWLEEHTVPRCMISDSVFYMSKKDAAFTLLTWS